MRAVQVWAAKHTLLPLYDSFCASTTAGADETARDGHAGCLAQDRRTVSIICAWSMIYNRLFDNVAIGDGAVSLDLCAPSSAARPRSLLR